MGARRAPRRPAESEEVEEELAKAGPARARALCAPPTPLRVGVSTLGPYCSGGVPLGPLPPGLAHSRR